MFWLYQMWVSVRNDPGSNCVPYTSFTTEIGSNFIQFRNSTNQDPSQPTREALSFQFWVQRSSVKIHLIGLMDCKAFWGTWEQISTGNYEHLYRQYDPEVINVKHKNHLLTLDSCQKHE